MNLIKKVIKAAEKATREKPTKLKTLQRGSQFLKATGSTIHSIGEAGEYLAEAGMRFTGQWDDDDEEEE